MKIHHITDLKNAINIINNKKASRVSSTLHGFPCSSPNGNLGSLYESENQGVVLVFEWTGDVSVNAIKEGCLVKYPEFKNGEDLYIVMYNNNPNSLRLIDINISDEAIENYKNELKNKKVNFFSKRESENIDNIIAELNLKIEKGLYISVV